VQFVSNVTANASAFVDPANYDYRLLPTATAVHAGSAPVTNTKAQQVAPVFEYVHQTAGRVRAAACNGGRMADGALDAGALQSSGPAPGAAGDLLPCDSVVIPVSTSVSPGAGGMAVTPATITLSASQQQQFTATLPPGVDPTVQWSLTGPGSLSDSGLYTAPATIAADATSTITATSVADQTKSAAATVSLRAPAASAARLSYAAFSPTTVYGGNPASLSLCVSSSVPAVSVDITLTSSAPDVLQAPATTTVASGTCATMKLTTVSPSSMTTATITATGASSGVQATLTVLPVALASLYVFPLDITGGRNSSSSKVTLSAPAPAAGFTVLLSSSDPTLTLQGSVTVPGGSTSATFTFSTTAVSATTPAVISAGGALSATVVVQPPTVTYAAVSPAAVTGGNTAKLSFTINVSPGVDLPVAVASSNPDVLPLPASITVPSGAAAGAYVFTTAPVSSPTPVNITVASGASLVNVKVMVVP